MARKSVCKLCRREGVKLFLKGDRCLLSSCSVEKRSFPPGQHGLRRSKQTDYSIRLREKQKAKNIYGLREAQFRRCFREASRKPGATGANLLQLLERRFDNVVYRLGIAPSRKAARQLVRHGNMKINNKRVNIPSYLIKVGDEISIDGASKALNIIKKSVERALDLKRVSSWLTLNQDELKGSFDRIPDVEEMNLPIQSQLIVEFYSR